MLAQFIFATLFFVAIGIFSKKIREIRRNINLGRPENRTDNPQKRLKVMFRVAFVQGKLLTKPIAGFFHFLIYAGFVLINIEVLEIVIDGLLGTHRIFAKPLGSLYQIAIGFFEILSVLVIVACVVFFLRRNVQKLKRFSGIEMTRWPRYDANAILVVEVVLMVALLLMNTFDNLKTNGEYSFAVSQYIAPLFKNYSPEAILYNERFWWWIHIVGIFVFLNYLPYSKHFHILMAFPNTYFSDLTPAGQLSNMQSITNEVKIMLDPNANPYAAADPNAAVERFGAKDVGDLSWKNLMDAYSCTECGRCTSVCPANMTGKKLSPRKIMMDTRDRLEEVGSIIDEQGTKYNDNKSLLHDYITAEEIWACTTCNACVEACPIVINPLNIIIELRRYLTMEEAKIPAEIGNMSKNIENNFAPWAFPAANRANWANDVQMNVKS